MPRILPKPLSSMRARLIASHAAVIVVALAIVLAIGAAWLRRHERDTQIAELRNLAVPLLAESRLITRGRSGMLRDDIATELFVRQAQDMDLRILVLDRAGRVLFDTEEAGTPDEVTLSPYATTIARVATVASARGEFVSVALRDRNRPRAEPFRDHIVVIAASGQVLDSAGGANVLMLVEPPRSAGVVARFLPPLLLALALALLVALGAGYLVSDRLAAPVTRLTAAARAMADGNLEQRVPDEGPDEIGRLAASFNEMSSRVAATDRAQRNLLADVSHELRTPLTNVDGYVQALRDGVLQTDAERAAALETISAEAGRMKSLINDLLGLARLESGQATLSLHPVETRKLLEDVTQRFANHAASQGLSLHVDAPAPLVMLADEHSLHRVLDNLVTNALRYTDAGGRIVLGAQLIQSGYVKITVRDTGNGIPPERLAHVFDRFVRIHDSKDGFGLGLPIARRLVELHGGTLSLDSQPNQGTTVTIHLPIHH